jgi:hypothetical protein
MGLGRFLKLRNGRDAKNGKPLAAEIADASTAEAKVVKEKLRGQYQGLLTA